MPSTVAFWLVVSLASAAVGGWLLYRGYTLYRQRTLIESTPTDDVWDLDPGPAEVTGTVGPVDGETLRAPFTDDTCLAAEWGIEEYDEGGKHSEWKTVGSGVVSVSAFELEDDTGTIRVETDGASFDFDRAATDIIEVGGPEDPPETVQQFLDVSATPGPSDQPLVESLDWGTQEGDRRYHHRLLEPGEEVYVYGTVHPERDVVAPSDPDNMAIRAADDGDEPMFLVSDRPQADLVRSRTVGLWRIPVGLVLLAVGGWLAVRAVGV